MSDSDPITVWIDGLRDADDIAALRVWNHFSQRLLELARTRLSPKTKRAYDEEDAVQSMFRSVCLGFAEGRFPDLKDRDSLWRLMLVITCQKISNRHRFDHRKRRDVRLTLTDSIFYNSINVTTEANLVSTEPAPEFVAEFVETCEKLFAEFDDPILEKITNLRLEGFSDSEIATQLDCSRRTVQRRLEIIRRKLASMEPIAATQATADDQ
ncbi:MAG: ECF-type sigma factor [Pirellulaceae bacterium]|nr:ECF-type sigma factor [Pirellulaceae bacterium]